MNRPDYLIIGHITKDLLSSGFTVGGTVAYSGLTARNLGRRVGVVTSASAELDFKEALPGIEVISVPSSVTTAFRNIYHDGTRQQFIKAVAERITSEAIPPRWYHSPIVQLGPFGSLRMGADSPIRHDDQNLCSGQPKGRGGQNNHSRKSGGLSGGQWRAGFAN